MTVLTNSINIIPIKISASLFVDINNLILKFMWRAKRPRIPTQYLKGRTKMKD